MRPFINLKPLENRIDGQGLFIENVSLATLLNKGQTPLYVTSLSAVEQRVQKYKSTLNQFFPNSNIFYACKANFSKPILNEVNLAGAGIDIVSIGEWHAAIEAGFCAQNICFAGVGKRETEWQTALLGGLGYLNIEHLAELEDVLNFIEFNKHKLLNFPVVSLRLNPCLEIETHPHLKTGALDSKFGILFDQFQMWLLEKKKLVSKENFLNWISPLCGIHIHVGSQLMEKNIFNLIVKNVLDCALFMLHEGVPVNHLDFGGGLGVCSTGVAKNGEDIVEYVTFLAQTIQEQSQHYPPLLKLWKPNFSNLFVCLEPGRSIVASSTIFLTTVLYTKENKKDLESYHFCYVDGAMNDFPRPSLYDAHHNAEIANLVSHKNINANKNINWKIVGPVCESGDYLSKCAPLPHLNKNDVICFFEGGAYCRSMASQYNLRPLPQELFVKENKIFNLIGELK